MQVSASIIKTFDQEQDRCYSGVNLLPTYYLSHCFQHKGRRQIQGTGSRNTPFNLHHEYKDINTKQSSMHCMCFWSLNFHIWTKLTLSDSADSLVLFREK